VNTQPGSADPVDFQSRIAEAYQDIVARYRAGDVAGATAARDGLCQELDLLLIKAHVDAQGHLAAGRPVDALGRFVDALEIHRCNLADLKLAVSVATTYDGLRTVYEALGQRLGAAAALRMRAKGGRSFYARPRACQLPVLGGLYEVLFGERRDGTFVEVGAYDGETYSNTSCLADLGWRGVYIEPVPDAAARCRARHAGNPATSVVECAIGDTDGTVRLWRNGPCSTVSPEAHAMHLSQGLVLDGELREIEVPQRRLDGVLAEAGLAPGFELLVVDVDGGEAAVFAGLDLARWQPRFLLVELIEAAPSFSGQATLIETARSVRAHIAAAGYAEIFRDPVNTLFTAPA
jgi:FkbM family methyltransferase